MVEIFEEAVELEIDVLEAVPLYEHSPRNELAAWPFPHLRKSGRTQVSTMRMVVLENPFLKLGVLPELGGRIATIYDKVRSREIVSLPTRLNLDSKSLRGASLSHGIEFEIGPERLNSLGPVDTLLLPAGSEEATATLWISELAAPYGISWHARIVMSHDQAEFGIEMRTYNRNWHGVWVNPGLKGLGPCLASDDCFVSQLGLCGSFDSGEMSGAFRRSEKPYLLGPHMLDAWRATFRAHAVENPIFASEDFLVGFKDESLQVHSTQSLASAKMVLRTDDGTLEATADLGPTQVFHAEIPVGSISAFAILSERETILQPLQLIVEFVWPQEFAKAIESSAPQQTDAQLREALRNPFLRPSAWLALAYRSSDSGIAIERVESSLMFNPEDHLAWIHKSFCEGPVEEPESVLNAHYLACLEPMLRCESFLTQGQEALRKDPSKLVEPLADSPDALVEVACILVESRRYEDLFRWVDECLRHREVAMLRYILAFAYVESGKHEFETAMQVQKVALQPVTAPYPWRRIERHVLETLSLQFPSDERIKDLLGLWEAVDKR